MFGNKRVVVKRVQVAVKLFQNPSPGYGGEVVYRFFCFSSPGRSPRRAIVLPPASVLAKGLTLKFFYVMGKALSGELSCPCDRSCLVLWFEKFW